VKEITLLFGPVNMGLEKKEKVHSTTLIYRRCLDFNPQSQNWVFDTYKLSNSFDLHTSTVFKVGFAYVAPSGLSFEVVFTYMWRQVSYPCY
jgi:hypothetical protein